MHGKALQQKSTLFFMEKLMKFVSTITWYGGPRFVLYLKNKAEEVFSLQTSWSISVNSLFGFQTTQLGEEDDSHMPHFIFLLFLLLDSSAIARKVINTSFQLGFLLSRVTEAANDVYRRDVRFERFRIEYTLHFSVLSRLLCLPHGIGCCPAAICDSLPSARSLKLTLRL